MKLAINKREPKLTTLNDEVLGVTWLNPTTKRAKGLVQRYWWYYNNTDRTTIFKAYGKPSEKKVKAFYEIEEEKVKVNGTGMRITGAGSDIFSCAYTVKGKDNNTYLIYHTPDNRFAVQLN